MVLGCLIGGFGLFLNCWLFILVICVFLVYTWVARLCFLGSVVFVFLGGVVCGWVWTRLVVLLAGYSGLALGLLTCLVWLVT